MWNNDQNAFHAEWSTVQHQSEAMEVDMLIHHNLFYANEGSINNKNYLFIRRGLATCKIPFLMKRTNIDLLAMHLVTNDL